MSFFDEADEPRTARRTAARTAPRPRRPSGSRRRPPPNRQAIQARRTLLFVVVIIAVVLIAVGIHSCAVSDANNALRSYNSHVVAVIEDSNATGRRFFSALSSGSNPSGVTAAIDQARASADAQLSRARDFSTPDSVKQAQADLVLALQMRRDAMANIGGTIQQALGSSASRDAINTIAAEMARFYASDVLYKDYSLPAVLGALRSAGIAVGGLNGQPIEGGQFLPDVRWLAPAFVASQLQVGYQSSASGKVAPGTHGHALTSVSVAGTTLQTGSTNSIPASPAPSFTLHFANTGQNTETNVVCKVTVTSGAGAQVARAQTTVPQTTPGQQASCQVQLSSSPAAGSYQVTATIVPVPGERNTANNSMTYPVSLH